ncbi:SoxR reducing system RseC family protein [Brucepastera parasyntrophica]|uniref:SoxR reducing system RseC family protein n=1 Tax=Brucepastera parasyntrophica TaxID=2880008 RepID=UPI00210C3A4A|nr:SoxR reducing system RseC family protein [Brucepastera parasyntrophica]ULQ61097.1 SoxR reducing system RseC family protein [Brucepastera parasyntrophica]
MKEKVRIIAIEKDTISAVPLDNSACGNCGNTGCGGKGGILKVKNSNKLDIYPGAEVFVHIPAGLPVFQVFSAIGLPVFLAAAALILTAVLLPSSGEPVRIIIAFAAFLAGCAAAVGLSRLFKNSTPEIISIL